MLIKIIRNDDHPRNFILFDAAEGVNRTCPCHLDDTAGLREWYTEKLRYAEQKHIYLINAMDFLADESGGPGSRKEIALSKSTHYAAASLSFIRHGKHHVILFDGQAFVCTDDGNTLERIIAGGLYENCDVIPDTARGFSPPSEPHLSRPRRLSVRSALRSGGFGS